MDNAVTQAGRSPYTLNWGKNVLRFGNVVAAISLPLAAAPSKLGPQDYTADWNDQSLMISWLFESAVQFTPWGLQDRARETLV